MTYVHVRVYTEYSAMLQPADIDWRNYIYDVAQKKKQNNSAFCFFFLTASLTMQYCLKSCTEFQSSVSAMSCKHEWASRWLLYISSWLLIGGWWLLLSERLINRHLHYITSHFFNLFHISR